MNAKKKNNVNATLLYEKENGGTLVPNEKLRNMRIGVDQEDKRRVEFAVYNLKFGPPLLCDVTQVSPLDQNGIPHPKCRLTLVVALRRNVLLRPNLPPTKTREALDRERCGFGTHDWRNAIRFGYI